MATGMIWPTLSAVFALYSLQNAIMFTPCTAWRLSERAAEQAAGGRSSGGLTWRAPSSQAQARQEALGLLCPLEAPA